MTLGLFDQTCFSGKCRKRGASCISRQSCCGRNVCKRNKNSKKVCTRSRPNSRALKSDIPFDDCWFQATNDADCACLPDKKALGRCVKKLFKNDCCESLDGGKKACKRKAKEEKWAKDGAAQYFDWCNNPELPLNE
jgi:hypothetical protein